MFKVLRRLAEIVRERETRILDLGTSKSEQLIYLELLRLAKPDGESSGLLDHPADADAIRDRDQRLYLARDGGTSVKSPGLDRHD